MLGSARSAAPLRLVQRMLRSGRGTTAIETAILLPLMLAFLLGIEELGRLLWTQSILQYACETAARCAVIGANNTSAPCDSGGTPSQTSVQNYASGKAFSLSVQPSAFTFVSGGTCGTTSSGATVTGTLVTATYTFQPLVPGLVPGLAITLNAKSCIPAS
jgi:Flp pilus assembly protein TadG